MRERSGEQFETNRAPWLRGNFGATTSVIYDPATYNPVTTADIHFPTSKFP